MQPSLETRLQWICLGDGEAASKVYDAKEGLEEEMEALRAGLALLIQENEVCGPVFRPCSVLCSGHEASERIWLRTGSESFCLFWKFTRASPQHMRFSPH